MSALRRGLALALLAASAASCAEAPPPPAVHVDRGPPPAPSPPPPTAARWVESGGATLVGPEAARGTLVLLGGRRALVAPGGAVETERAPASEPLVELAEVPTHGGTVLVGRGAHDVYRFDDPLGAPLVLARSQARIAHLGAVPEGVAVWIEGADAPRFVDVATGDARTFPADLPEPPLRAVVFVDEKRGAGVFEAVGLCVTTDGGATWRLASGPGARDALGINGLRRRGAAVRAFVYPDGPDAPVDLVQRRLGRMEPPAETAEPPLLSWIRASGRDPLEAAATGGLTLPSGGALVASHGMIARVDPASGAVSDLVVVARAKWDPCTAARAAETAWVACTLPSAAAGAGRELFDPFGVLEVPLAGAKLALDRPVLVRNGEAELRVSASGGVMLTGACSNDEPGQACVRQPDGKWKTVSPSAELAERGAGPLADGRVAFLRGIFDGDDPPEAPPADAATAARNLHVALMAPGGREQALAPIGFTPSRGYVRVQSPLEEDTDHTLRLVIEDGDGPFAVMVPPGQRAPEARRIPDAREARLHDGRGIAVGEGHVLTSLDGGATWNDVPSPPAALGQAREIAAAEGGSDLLGVSETGARLGTMLRLGWGPEVAAPSPAAALAPARSTIPAPAAPALGPELSLACASGGPAQGAPPLLGGAQIRKLLGAPATPRAGVRRDASVWSPSRGGMLDTVALFEEEAPEARDAPPTAWTFSWHDPREVGGKPRHVTLKPPAGAAWGTSLRFAAADGARALFAVRSGGKLRLVRVKVGGAPEVVEVPQDLVPAGEVVFGADRGEPIAWSHETEVVAWLAGEQPRPIAELGTHAARALGTPTAAGVPLLLGGSDWALFRVLPAPVLDRAAPEVVPPAVYASLEGWTRMPAVRAALGSLPACPARPKGARFALGRPGLRAEIDGAAEGAATAVYTVRVAGTGTGACVESIAAALTPKQQGGGAAFVRVDLGGKRAEGGDRGLAPEAVVRQMRCALGGG